MERNVTTSRYKTNKKAKAKIDKVLHYCSTVFANVGTKTPLDVGSYEEAKRIEDEKLIEIKEISPIFYDIIKKEPQCEL